MGGPKVFLEYDQEQLDRAYDQSAYAPNQQEVALRQQMRSTAARSHLGEPRRFSYGPAEIEQLDVYPTDRPNAPIVVFVHGGAWRGGSAANSAHAAEMFVAAGAHYVALDFVLVEAAGGSLYPMVEQVRRALAWLYGNAAQFGGDRARIHLIGHSSGAHLGGCLMVTDWTKAFDLPPDVIKTGFLTSGMYDLEPVSLSKRSEYVRFTPAMIEDLSAIRSLNQLTAPLVLAYGSLETPEFQRQTREFSAALSQADKPFDLVVGEGYNHFEILETLGNPFGLLGRAALRQIGLTFSP